MSLPKILMSAAPKIMGMVFGKQTVAEPAFTILLDRTNNAAVNCTYELRSYGRRFAAQTKYSGNPSDDSNETNEPFRALARYIGVFGTPENDGTRPISMTSPVAMTNDSGDKNNGTPIAMTAPVAMSNDRKGERLSSGNDKVMKFFLPEEFDDMSKIPKPTNPHVTIEEIPPSVGAVHRFSGSWSNSTKDEKASCLAKQLMSDMNDGGGDHDDDDSSKVAKLINEEYVMDNYEFFGFNPPFTIPMFRRNEIYIELTQAQVQQLLNKYGNGNSLESAN